MKITIKVAIILSVVLAGSGTLRAFHDGDHGEGPTDRIFRVSKTGEVIIGTNVKIGNLLVRRGKYLLTHRADGDRHVFVLAEVDKRKAAPVLSSIEFASRFLSNAEQVKNSLLVAKEQRDRSFEVVKIQIAGENGDHVLSTSLGGDNANSSDRD